MKIKKSKAMTVQPGAAGGAAIADRFKLDVPAGPSAKNGTVNKTAALVALVAGIACLAAVGVLAYLLWDHWQFLQQV